MDGTKKSIKNSHILIIGSGIIGKFNALELSEKGFNITIADPQKIKNSSSAALGLLTVSYTHLTLPTTPYV